MTRLIVLYRVVWPDAAPFGVPALFDVELALIWLPWAIGALAVWRGCRGEDYRGDAGPCGRAGGTITPKMWV